MHPEAMRVHAPATVRPDFAQILARVRNLRPQIEERALAAEKAKRVPAETIEALRDTTVFRLMQPARFGGYEYGPAEMAEVGFELGRACGSTGWCGTLAVCFGWMTSFFPLQAQQEVWDDRDNLLAVSYTPSPKVEVVDGGIKIAGSWHWASGVDSAAWLILSVLIPGKDAPPTLAWCLVPVRGVIVDHDSWNVSGLQGTGSKTVAIHDAVFVPAHRILPLGAIFSGKVPGLDVPGNGQARFGYPTFGPTARRADRRDGARGPRCVHRNGARRKAHGEARRLRESRGVATHPELDRPGGRPHRCRAHAHAVEPARRPGHRAIRLYARDRTARSDTPQSRICGAHLVRGRQRDLRQVGRGGG